MPGISENLYLTIYKEQNGITQNNELVPSKGECQYQYGHISYTKFSEKYSDNGWESRKIIALPAMLWTGIIMSLYHLTNAILQKRENERSAQINHYLFKRNLQEGYGWLITLINDKQGSYEVQESQFHKICYDKFVERLSYRPSLTYSPASDSTSSSKSAKSSTQTWSSSASPSNIFNSYKTEKQVALENMRLDGSKFKSLPYSMRSDADVVIMAINNSRLPVIKDASFSMQINKKVALAAVRKDGLWLEHLSFLMQNDDEVVAEAVKNNRSAYKYASSRLQNKYQPKSYFQSTYSNPFDRFHSTFSSSQQPKPKFNYEPKSTFKTRFDDFFRGAQSSAGAAQTPAPKVEWSCPAELKDDNSEVGIIAKRVLKEEHDNSAILSASSPDKRQVKALFCKMLGIDTNSTDEVITSAYRKISLKLHPDRCENKFGAEAFKPLAAARKILE